MHTTIGTIYVDKGDVVHSHNRNHELILDGSPERLAQRPATIVLPSDPSDRLHWLDQLIETADAMRRDAYRTLAEDPRSHEVPAGEIAAND